MYLAELSRTIIHVRSVGLDKCVPEDPFEWLQALVGWLRTLRLDGGPGLEKAS